MFNWRKLQNQDLILLFLTIALCGAGLLSVFTTTFFDEMGASRDFRQQILFLIIGWGIYFCVTAFESRWLNEPKVELILWLVGLLALISLFFLSTDVGPKRWLRIGELSVQPSEFAKLVIITITATLFASNKKLELVKPLNIRTQIRLPSRFKHLIQSPYFNRLLINSVAVGAIVSLVLLQPSLGNSIIAVSIWLLMLTTLLKRPFTIYIYAGLVLVGANTVLQLINFQKLYDLVGFSFQFYGIDLVLICLSVFITIGVFKIFRLNLIAVIACLCVGISSFAVMQWGWGAVLNDYQRDRVVAFLNPSEDPLGAQWQVNQARIAIGSGQIFGRGVLQGSQTNSGLLPYAYTDFAYAAWAEQFGLIGCTALILFYLALIWRILWVSDQTDDNFGRLVCIGVAIMLGLNTVINIGMNLGIMPVTGVPLPLVSYGGSSVLVNMLGLGLVQMIHTENTARVTRFEKLGQN